MIKKLARVLEMSLTDTLHFVLDVIQLLGAGGWEAVTGWKDGYDWKSWAYNYVPKHVDDQTLLTVLFLMSVSGMPSDIIRQHNEHNLVEWESYLKMHPDDRFIEHQSHMQKILYGKYNASYNACEVIAVYNALLFLNAGQAPVRFPDLLSSFEETGICAKGAFGTSPLALDRYIEISGYETDMLIGRKINDSKLRKLQSDYRTYILTIYNDENDLGEAIHTVSITESENDGKNRYSIHNAGEEKTFLSLADAVFGYHQGKGEPISVIGVR